MVRSMYSGVSGLRSHQTRMDTIGNNIANVNTYGFKSARTSFRDIYYQQISSASQPTAAQGGMNPSAVGYGVKVGSVDLMMGRSTFTMTDQTMDLAIDGDGFFQVQDAAGNTYYTRAGMLNFDAAGNLVDMQGNFVLGINGDPSGRTPGSERIQVTLPPVPPTPSSVVQTINGKEFTIRAQNPTTDGNLNFNFTTDNSVADGQMSASISATGIIIKMNPSNSYASLAEFNNAVNDAIFAANGNKEHPGGRFEISYTGSGADPFAGGLTAAEITSTDFGIQRGSAAFPSTANNLFGGIFPTGVGNDFSGNGPLSNYTCTFTAAAGGSPAFWTVSMQVGGQTYTGTVDANRTGSGEFFLQNTTPGAASGDHIVMRRPSFNGITDAWNRENGVTAEAAVFNFPALSAAQADGATISVAGQNYTVDATTNPTAAEQTAALIAAINADAANPFSAQLQGGNIVLTARTAGNIATAPTVTVAGTGQTVNTTTNGVDGVSLTNGDAFLDTSAALAGANDAFPSYPSRNLGFSGTAFALRGGTAGGPQTIADMTGISIAPNGIITGWDSQGEEIIIGRIDLATFANPSGLNQAGSSNYTTSANSGQPILTQPGTSGAGKLVGGSLELSNVDLSREFSDMITTQRGYQANSRIITVSDTMLEELINLKR